MLVAAAVRPIRTIRFAGALGAHDLALVSGLPAGAGAWWPSLLPCAKWTRPTLRCPLTRWCPVRPRRACSGPQDPWALQSRI